MAGTAYDAATEVEMVEKRRIEPMTTSVSSIIMGGSGPK